MVSNFPHGEPLLTARPPARNVDDFELGSWGPDWQHEASSRTEQHFKDVFFAATLSSSAQAAIRSRGGRAARMALMTCSTCRITTISPQLFCVTLLCRLRLPLHLTVNSCLCGLPLDEFGFTVQRALRLGFLSKRGFALENVVARICREAG